MKFISNSEKQTKKFGKDLAKKFKGGEVLALHGQLGAGKTALAQGIALGLGIEQPITSPTFTLMNVYPVSQNNQNISQFVHIDCYRIKNADWLVQVGVLDFLYDYQTVCVVEWAEKIAPLLSPGVIAINIKAGLGNKRTIEIKN